MNFRNLLSGRINRTSLLAVFGILTIPLMAVFLLLILPLGENDMHTKLTIITIINIAYFIILIPLLVRRAHDVGLSTKWTLFFLLTPLSTLLLILPGTDGENKYGPRPVSTNKITKIMASMIFLPLLIPAIAIALMVLPIFEKLWVIEASCNNPEHVNFRKEFTSMKECGEYTSKHLDQFQVNCDKPHSVGCDTIKSPISWLLPRDFPKRMPSHTDQ